MLEQADIVKEKVDAVGSKNANLGGSPERRRPAGPGQFRRLTGAPRRHVRRRGAAEEIEKRVLALEPDNVRSLTQASEEIRST